ncbi:MAG: glycosyltransferase family 2 protein [Solirubrobacterales bacterium]
MNEPRDPLVSVCLPTYNYAQFLPRAVESVLAQSFTDFELLVYDDASTDDTIAVMQPYLEDPRVKFVVQEENQGLFANFNQSAAGARGKYIKYLCADDFLDPDFLTTTVPMLDDPAVEIATCANWLIDADDQLTGEQVAPFGARGRVEAVDAAKALAEWHNVVGMPTNTLVRRDTLLSVGGFDARFAPAADIHLWLKLLAHGDLAWSPARLCFIRIHSTHSHSYGPDPTESPFLVWSEAQAIPNSPATPEIVDRALQCESQRVYLYVAAHLLQLRFRRAQKLLELPRGYVSQPGSFLRWLATWPKIALAQGRRIFALRSRRMVIYDPLPRIGEPLAAATSELPLKTPQRH